MSDASRQLAGILFVLIPTIEFGGWSLLRMIDRPSRMITLVYLGALLLAAATVTLGVSLL